jgi:hypothetical protein
MDKKTNSSLRKFSRLRAWVWIPLAIDVLSEFSVSLFVGVALRVSRMIRLLLEGVRYYSL